MTSRITKGAWKTPELEAQARTNPWGTGWVAAGLLLWFAATAWARPLTLPDEGRYVGVAWEMLRSGDWLTPTLNGLPFFHKPPLFYWITAAAMSLFGVHEAAGRTASILGAALATWALYCFMRRWAGERAARWALMFLAAQPLFFVGGQFANLDMLVAGCISATTLLLAHSALCAEQRLPYRRSLWAAYGMAALGVLAKGLIGAVLPALVILLWLLLSRRWRLLWPLCSATGLAVFGLIAAPWFVVMQSRFDDFFNYFFVVQHFKRFAAGGFNNAQPVWFYPAVLLLLSLPCLPWLWLACRRAGRGDSRDAAAEPRASALPQTHLRVLMWSWAGAIVLFFSLPQSKLLGYVLPAVPPLAGLMALGALSLSRPRVRQWVSASLVLSVAVGLAAVAVLTRHTPHSTRSLAQALQQRQGADEPVIMLQDMFYDLPVYAHLKSPVMVLDDWANPLLRQRDNWRKELADAGEFSPSLAKKLLINPEALFTAVCTARVSWLIGANAASWPTGLLPPAEVVLTQDQAILWRLDAQALAPVCPLPGVGSPPTTPRSDSTPR